MTFFDNEQTVFFLYDGLKKTGYAGFGNQSFFEVKQGETICWQGLNDFLSTKKWKFGWVGYDVKNAMENLTSQNDDELKIPDILFVQPKTLVKIKQNKGSIIYGNENKIKLVDEFLATKTIDLKTSIILSPKIKKADYLKTFDRIKTHIKQGDVYEINYCHEFFHSSANIQPLHIYKRLIETSPAPFSCFVKYDDFAIMSNSPERYFKKQNDEILCQPIKGTSRRGKDDLTDERLKNALKNSKKERAENIMVVDLIRNDLSKICQPNSLNVSELCEIYSFETVHQMISTIKGKLKTNTSICDILKATFPMGSMTGMPKISMMNIAEELEQTKRGLYSGSIGYITPDGNCDFNVVIRTLLYNAKNKYLSAMVGGAITIDSEAESEYQETLVKLKAIQNALKNNAL